MGTLPAAMRSEGFLSCITKALFVWHVHAPCTGLLQRHVLFSSIVDKAGDALMWSASPLLPLGYLWSWEAVCGNHLRTIVSGPISGFSAASRPDAVPCHHSSALIVATVDMEGKQCDCQEINTQILPKACMCTAHTCLSLQSFCPSTNNYTNHDFQMKRKGYVQTYASDKSRQ